MKRSSRNLEDEAGNRLLSGLNAVAQASLFYELDADLQTLLFVAYSAGAARVIDPGSSRSTGCEAAFVDAIDTYFKEHYAVGSRERN